MRCILFLIASFIIQVQVSGQHVLIVEKEGKAKRDRYFKGDYIEFKTPSTFSKKTGVITNVTDTTFDVSGERYKVNDVTHIIYPKRKNIARIVGKMFRTTALTTFVISGLDRGFNQKVSPIYDEHTLKFVGFFAIPGLVAYLVPEKKIKLGGKVTLRIMDITPG